jgi:mono/diheme cytochrome c family protein
LSLLDRRNLLLCLALVTGALAACYTGPDIGTASSGPTASAPTGNGAGTATRGLPCEIATLIETQCASCHGAPPRSGATTTLTAREALAGDWEGRPLGVVALERMRDTASPMPPEGPLPAADVDAFAKWVDEGMPEGTCGSVDGNAHTPVELKCMSGRFWTEGDDEGDELMTPGQACIACHTKENTEHASKNDEDDDEDDELEAPAFTAAGTVYPTLHEPDDCFGIGTSGTQVILTGADGKRQTLTVNRAGNFMTELPLALPYTASVVRGGNTRTMKAAQNDGDCNGCHTAEGGVAPGRILAP